MMANLNSICDASGLEDGKPVAAKTPDGRDLVVVSHRGKVHVLDGTCPHRGAPLAEGWVSDGCLVCPWHGWAFELKSGQYAPKMGVATHRCEIVEGRVQIKG